jgi:hypothetical protein
VTDRVLRGDAPVAWIDQPDGVRLDAPEAVRLEPADEREGGDAGERGRDGGKHQRAAGRACRERARRRAARRVELGVLAQDRLVQVTQLGPRLDPDLLDQDAAGVAVGLERLRLAP